MANLSDFGKAHVDLIRKHICLKKPINCIISPKEQLKSPSIRLIGNLASSNNEEDVSVILNFGGLQALKYVLSEEHNTPIIVREACWAISNIAIGPFPHIKKILDNGFVEILKNLVLKSTNFHVIF